MIRISNIKYPLEKEVTEKELLIKVSKILKIGIESIENFRIHKKSIDAREKVGGFYVIAVEFNIANEDKYLSKHSKDKNISKVEPFSYIIEKKQSKDRPIIIGFGPAGLMAGLVLARASLNPIIVEMGKEVSKRKDDVKEFWENGNFNKYSNVQFGEGGAGTFSDGKLTTGIKDPRCRFLLEEFVKASAPKEILYEAKPHIGTDNLITMVKNIREEIISLGGTVLFEHKMIDLLLDYDNNKTLGVTVQNLQTDEKIDIFSNNVILSIGHSSRDTFELLKEKNQPMERKPFAVGVRIEHKQKLINDKQYGKFAKYLPPAEYKLAVRTSNNRGAYTFCMCPGGFVVNSSSEENRLVTNGMSFYKRYGKNANAALLVEVKPEDFGSDDVLAGIQFQRKLEEKAFVAGGSNYSAPVQKVGDFLKGIPSTELGDVKATFKPSVTPSNLKDILPDFVYETLKLAILDMDKKIKGFANKEAVLTGVESRSSSPLRVIRNQDDYQSIKYAGLYPCGEGCGYAGGIVSAGVDGVRCAEKIIESI